MTTALAHVQSCELWAATDDGDSPIHYHDARTTLTTERSGGEEVQLHVFAPGEETNAVVTISLSLDEAQRLGIRLIQSTER